jgi:hypothetical protein
VIVGSIIVGSDPGRVGDVGCVDEFSRFQGEWDFGGC